MTKDNEKYDEAFELLADDVGVLDAKVLGVFGAMQRGLSKEEALKKYDITSKDYDENICRFQNEVQRFDV